MILQIKKQRKILDSRKNLLSTEAITLRNYYENKLNEYKHLRNKAINNLSVTAEIINTNQPKQAI